MASFGGKRVPPCQDGTLLIRIVAKMIMPNWKFKIKDLGAHEIVVSRNTGERRTESDRCSTAAAASGVERVF